MADDAAQSERIITPMPKHLVKAVDDYRFAKRLPSRAEAIRHLLTIGIAADRYADAASGDEKIRSNSELYRVIEAGRAAL